MNKGLENNLLLTSVFFLPLYQIPCYACWALIVLLRLTRKRELKINRKIFWALYLFFALHCVALFRSPHLPDALSELAVKTPLILFPVFFFPLLVKETMEKLKIALCYGCLAACLFVFIKALIKFGETG